jgi:RHS repeat-associated protein
MRSIRRGLTFAVAVLILGPMVNGVVRPEMAFAAIGPSVPLPEAKSTPVAKQVMHSQPQDQASAKALSGNQAPPSTAPLEGGGSNTATSLSPSATWQVATQTGDFSWSYPLRVPPAPGGLEPDLALSYASSAVDGRTSATNNQASWVGDGWALSPGFVERSYRGCAEDDAGDVTPAKVGDLCWGSDNATASFSGGAGMLIRDDATGVWRNKSEDGSRIERLTGAANGDDNGESWKITTVDGTQYFFGSRPESKSTWTVPVFGDDAHEPCHLETFATSVCTQAWRWNLDKVVDRHGNMMIYDYVQETNSYGLNNKDAAVPYVRGGTLRQVEYGLRAGDASVPATGRVAFTTADRCVPGSDCVKDKKDNWPDVPWDDNCETATCVDKHSPTFWSTKRLATITTQVRRGGDFTDVDSWTLDQQYPNPEDGGKAALWLKSITHTGLTGGSASLPAVTFEGTKMVNRVFQTDGFAPLIRYRITGIVSESGGVISIVYALPNCVAGSSMPADAKTNTLRCFPQEWSTKNHTPRTDYFHKYVVASVTQSDRISSSTEQVTSYSYGDAAWHYNMSEFMQNDKRTWDEFRGFGEVTVRTGITGESGPGGKIKHWYYRGLNGDQGRPPVKIADSERVSRVDDDWLQGFEMESATYLGDTDEVVDKVISEPFSRQTATRGAFKAYLVRQGVVQHYTALASGGWRTTRTETTYDERGLPTQSGDLGDTSTTADDRCTTTTYADNIKDWLRNLPRRVETVGVQCGATPTFPQDAISDTLTAYDGGDFTAAPTVGDATRTDEMAEHPPAGPVYVTTGRAGYDAHGRTTQTSDALGRTSKTAYTPALGGPTTQTVETNPLNHTVTTTLEPAWGQDTIVVDANRRRTETAYDPLGRAVEVWLPNHLRSDNPEGSSKFSYRVNRDSPTVVGTTTIGPEGNYTTANILYDGLLRPRQTQTPAVGGGRLLTDTRYDSQGRAFKTTKPYFNDAAVDDQLWLAADTAIDNQTVTQFDGAGRKTAEIVKGGTTVLWQTTTTYGGDRVNVTPPRGGTATTTVTDARGQTTELRQYQGGSPTGAFDATTYTYTKRGETASVTDPANNTWRNTYDLRGNTVKVDDPDKGTSTMTFDAAGQLTTSTDARRATPSSDYNKLSYDYDLLGRRTAVKSGATTLAAWTYDTAASGKGQPASSIRYVGDAAYKRVIGAYSSLYQPLDTTVVIPDTEAGLAGTYKTSTATNADGTLSSKGLPQIGDLPAETLSFGYDARANPTTLSGGLSGGTVDYVTRTDYTAYGALARVSMGAPGKRVWQTYLYETNTRRLERSIVDAEVPHPMQSDVHLSYDPNGDVTSAADKTLDAAADTQCFRYDGLQRLTEAWTPAGGCDANPSTSGLAGPAPYWQSFTYDKVGNRLTDTQHAVAGDTARTYAYPAAGAHGLKSVTTATTTGTTKDEYTYDATGNVITRPGQTLTWDPEGKLADVTEGGKKTEYVYDADGNRLIRRDPAGRTLYLDSQELRLDTAGKLSGTRYYEHAGSTVAMRTGSGVTWLGNDHQDTTQVAVDDATQRVTKRRQTPFGASRGEAVAFPGEKGFVGGTVDASTGLLHLGAREYDPVLGRFLSVDPVLNPADPQQMNGYTYSGNNPVTKSDPTGLYAPSCNKFGDCMQGVRGPDPAPAPAPPPRRTAGLAPSCNKGGDCAKGVQGKKPPTRPACDAKSGDCRPGLRGPSIEELASRADRVSWEENRKVGAPPVESDCGFWCSLGRGARDLGRGMADRFMAVTNSAPYKWIGVALGVAGMFGCVACALVSVGMSAMATTGNCIAGKVVDCATGVASLALGGVGGKLIGKADDMWIRGDLLAGAGHAIRGAVVKGVSYLPRALGTAGQIGSSSIDTTDASGGFSGPSSGEPGDCKANLRC